MMERYQQPTMWGRVSGLNRASVPGHRGLAVLMAAFFWLSGGVGCDEGPETASLPPVVDGPETSVDDLICDARQRECLSLSEEGKCGFDGTYYQYTAACEAAEVCSPEGPGECLPVICETGQRRCGTDKSSEICGPHGDVWLQDVECGEDYVCNAGRCTLPSCLSQVLFVIDRSGSMQPHWSAVRNATQSVIASNPVARFGAVGFPRPGSFCGTPPALEVDLTTVGLEEKLDEFFFFDPFGKTPLVTVLRDILERGDEIFGGRGGAVVVLTDGYDTCVPADESSPEAMAALAQALKAEHNLSTYAIGYEFQGATSAGLKSLAANGSTSYSDYLRAGNEQELADVFGAIVSDWKLCF